MTIPTIQGRRFAVGRYEVVAMPMPHSAHMLRYTVYLYGERLGALLSVPTESDCRFLENPPYVPELVPWKPIHRAPGRPKKGTPPRVNETPPAPRDELADAMAFPRSSDER